MSLISIFQRIIKHIKQQIMINKKYTKAIESAIKLRPDEMVYLIGVRRITDVDRWNDTFILYSPYGDLYWECDDFTTDPGLAYLYSPINPKGTAILMEGWHSDIWGWGYHNGKYKALVQVNSCCVYRDNTRDSVLNMDARTRDCGYFGINLHHGFDSEKVGKNSAGCQVFRYRKDFNKLLDILERRFSHQRYFSYYLWREIE